MINGDEDPQSGALTRVLKASQFEAVVEITQKQNLGRWLGTIKVVHPSRNGFQNISGGSVIVEDSGYSQYDVGHFVFVSGLVSGRIMTSEKKQLDVFIATKSSKVDLPE